MSESKHPFYQVFDPREQLVGWAKAASVHDALGRAIDRGADAARAVQPERIVDQWPALRQYGRRSPGGPSWFAFTRELTVDTAIVTDD